MPVSADGPTWRRPMQSTRAAGIRYSDPLKRLEFKGQLSRYRRLLAGEPSRWDATDFSVDDHFGYEQQSFFRRNDELNPMSGKTVGRTQPGLASSSRDTGRASSSSVERYRGSPAKTSRNSGGAFYRSKDWQPLASPDRRLSPLSKIGSGAGKFSESRTQSFGTMFSRYGANKDIGGGALGMSASRVRSSKEFMSNPQTWMKRSLYVYVADEVSRAYVNWRNWNVVDYTMTDDQAKAALAQERVKDFGSFVLGTVMNASTSLFEIGHRGTLALGASLGIADESLAAKELSFFQDYAQWASGAYHGPGPRAIMERLKGEVNSEVERRKRSSKEKARNRFSNMVSNSLERTAQELQLRGVNPDFIMSRWRGGPEGQRLLSDIQKLQLEADTRAGDFNMVDIKKAALNRLKAERK